MGVENQGEMREENYTLMSIEQKLQKLIHCQLLGPLWAASDLHMTDCWRLIGILIKLKRKVEITQSVYYSVHIVRDRSARNLSLGVQYISTSLY